MSAEVGRLTDSALERMVRSPTTFAAWVLRAAVRELRERRAQEPKALAVVEAARGLDKWQHTCEGDLPDEDEAEAAFEALYSNWANLRAALAAFDEVKDR